MLPDPHLEELYVKVAKLKALIEDKVASNYHSTDPTSLRYSQSLVDMKNELKSTNLEILNYIRNKKNSS